MTPAQKSALTAFAPAAVAVEKATGWPAEVSIAQWAAESRWGERMTGQWNYFGLTSAAATNAGRAFVPTSEEMFPAQFNALPNDEKASLTSSELLPSGKRRYHLSRWFASFGSLEEALAAYVGLLTKPGSRYWPSWASYKANGDLDRLINGIAGAGFATGSGYATLLKQIAHQDSVTTAVLAAHEAQREKV